MSWSYDATDLGTSDATKRKNSVRLLVGDTDTNDQQVQDEEITFALSQTNDNVYYAAAWVASTISSLYSRRVTTELDSSLVVHYSDLSKKYRELSTQLRQDGQRFSGGSLGVFAGGISIAVIDANRSKQDRPKPFARQDRFRSDPTQDNYIDDYVGE